MKENKEINITSEVVEKAVDIVAESTENSRNSLDKNFSKGINKFFQLLNATPVGIKIETYIAERPYKLEKAMEEMKKKYETIPEEKRIEPSSTIAINVAKEMNYYLDEDYIREMFENILVADMNIDKQSIVSPAFIDLVKQLTKDDAKFLNLLNQKAKDENPLFEVVRRNEDHTYVVLSKKVLCFSETEYMPLEPIVLDNLIRMNFIEITNDEYLAYDTRYDSVFNIVKKEYTVPEGKTLEINKRKLNITELGQRFIKVCLDDK
ncbi:MAG: DUF4393 domain-containing protein [Clostridiales bacterium]|nr:DUF4393 domain-containing protein [Clostridiales bacterium]